MYTQEQLTALTEAISLGATSVQYADKKVEYRSLNEMLRLKNTMEAQLGIGKTNRRKYVEYTRG